MSSSEKAQPAWVKTETESREMITKLIASMTPESYVEHLRNLEFSVRESERKREREEIVCRLLAGGMPTEEIAVLLCRRVAEIELIQQNNIAIKIPEYAKKLKERQKRRQKQ